MQRLLLDVEGLKVIHGRELEPDYELPHLLEIVLIQAKDLHLEEADQVLVVVVLNLRVKLAAFLQILGLQLVLPLEISELLDDS